jgi:hypothetical protein
MTNYAVSHRLSPGQAKLCPGKCHGFQAKLHYSAYQRKIYHHNADEIKALVKIEIQSHCDSGMGQLLEAYSAAILQRAQDGGVLGDIAHGICFSHVNMGAGFYEGVETDFSHSEAFGAR